MTKSDEIRKDWNGGYADVKPIASISGFGEVTTGAKFEVFGGSKYEYAAGSKNSVFLGLENKTSFGSKTDIGLGTELKITLGPQWTSPKTAWFPLKSLLAKYDFTDIKEHKLVISPDGSTDILVKKQNLAKKYFQATAGYGLVGNLYYVSYTKIVSNMITTMVGINVLLQSLNFLNGFLTNPAYNRKEGFDWKSQARTSWFPILLQMMTTWGQMTAALHVVLGRDLLKKTVSPQSVLQLRDGKGAYLGARHTSSGVITSLQQGDTIKIGATKPAVLDRLGYAFGKSPFEYAEVDGKPKKGDEITGPKNPIHSYFEASHNKAIAFSQTIEIQANKDQKAEVKSNAGLLEPPNILIKADGDSKAKIVAEAKNITLRTGSKADANVKLVLAQEKNKARLTVDKTEKNGLIMNSESIALKNRKGELNIKQDVTEVRRKGSGTISIKDAQTMITHGSFLAVTKNGVTINKNLIVFK